MTRHFIWISAAVLLSAAPAAAAERPAVAISRVEGECVLIRSEEEISVKRGDGVAEGDMIRTGTGSQADVAWAGLWGCRVLEASDVGIVSLDLSDQRVKLERGGMLFRFDPMPSRSQFRLETPTAVAAVRGTQFFARVSRDKEGSARTTIAVSQGEVEVGAPDGIPLRVPAGKAAEIAPGADILVRDASEDERQMLRQAGAVNTGRRASRAGVYGR